MSVAVSPRRRTAFATTLVFVMAVSAYTQFLLGMLGPLITVDLGLSRTEFGALTTAIFLIGGVGAPLIGPLVDSLGGRRVLFLLFAAGSTSWVVMGSAGSFAVLLAGACFAGFVRGASNPVGNQLIARHAAGPHQGLIMGISKSGAQIGAFAVGVAVPPAAVLIGWRGVMYASLGLAVVGVVAVLAVIPPDGSRAELREHRRGSAGSGSSGLLGWLGTNAALIGFGTGSVNAYLPLFAVERLDMTVAAAGAIVSTMALTGIVGRILWGRQSDRFSAPQLPLVLVAGFGAVSLVLMGLAQQGGPLLLWAGAVLFSVSAGSWITVGMLAVIRQVTYTHAGRTSGVVLGFYYGGFACSPVLFGALVDATGSYPLAWIKGAIACLVAGVVAAAWHRRAAGRAAPPDPGDPEHATGGTHTTAPQA